MSDLIRRSDAIDALGEEPDIWTDTEEEWAYRNSWVEHISAIKALPSAEAVEVVRCKDCKYYKKINPKAKSGMCYKDIVASAWNDDGFCSRGERKGGNTDD